MKISNQIFLGVVLYLFIFNITLSAIGLPSVFFVLFGALAANLIDSRARHYVFASIVDMKLFVLISFLVGAYGALLSAFWGENELIFTGIFLKLVMVMAVALTLVFYFRSSLKLSGITDLSDALLIFLDLLFWVCAAQAFSVVLSFLSPDVRDIFNNLLENRGNIDSDHLFRFKGLHDSGGFSLAVMLGIFSVYGLYSGIVLRRGYVVWRLFVAVLMIFAIALVGRTGFLILALGYVLMFARWPLRVIKSTLMMLGLSILIILPLVNYFFAEQVDFFNRIIYDYAFEFIVNYQDNGSFSTTSSDDLKTMLFIPDLLNIFLGVGTFIGNTPGVDNSDSGYLKTLLTSGLLGFVLIYSVTVAAIARIIKSVYQYKDIFYFLIIVLLSLLIVEIKGPAFYQNDTSRFFMLIYCVVLAFSNIKSNHGSYLLTIPSSL